MKKNRIVFRQKRRILDLDIMSYTKINTKQIKDLEIKVNIIKLSKENIG